jgi:hypothetical protein
MSEIIVTPGSPLVVTINPPTVSPVIIYGGEKGDTGATGPAGPSGPAGADGADGANGADGADGVGVPAGGDTGKFLVKQSGTDYDTTWDNVTTVLEVVNNASGGTLGKGSPVHITGEDASGNPTVIAARADTAGAMPAHFVLNESIANGATGEAILIGMIENVNTSSFSAGDALFVAPTGGYTTTKPTGSNQIQKIAVVSHVDASTGTGYVTGAGRSNDVPNLTTGKIFIGSASNTVESAYTLPTSDGSANQFMKTDGAGAVTFTSITQATGNELENVVEDTTPQLGGALDSNGNGIRFRGTGHTNYVAIAPSTIEPGSNVTFFPPTADGTTGQVIQTNGSGRLSFTDQSGGLADIVDDTTPQLGGNLDLNSNNITGTGNIDTTGTLGLTNTTTDDSLLITTTEDSNTAAPVITLKRNSASPADGDYLGQLKFKGENDADQEVIYAKITGKISDATDTTEDGLIEFALRKAGSNNIGARLTSTDLKLINGTGLEVGGYSFPTSDGTSGQVLQTDGAGTLSFQTASSGYKMLQTYSYSDTGTTDKFFVQNATTELSGSNAARDYRSAYAIPVAGSIGDCTMVGAVAVNGNAYRLYVWINNTSTYYAEATGGNGVGDRYTVRWTSWKNVSDDSDASDPSFSANDYLAFQLVPTGSLSNPGSVSLSVLTSHT